jgi:hypothetical protein
VTHTQYTTRTQLSRGSDGASCPDAPQVILGRRRAANLRLCTGSAGPARRWAASMDMASVQRNYGKLVTGDAGQQAQLNRCGHPCRRTATCAARQSQISVTAEIRCNMYLSIQCIPSEFSSALQSRDRRGCWRVIPVQSSVSMACCRRKQLCRSSARPVLRAERFEGQLLPDAPLLQSTSGRGLSSKAAACEDTA